MELLEKKPSVEIDFLNKYIFMPSYDPEASISGVKKIDPNLMDKFFENIDPFWHTENDQLQYFIYYSNGEYICQRKKLKYNFETKTNYWQTYNFKNVSQDKVLELYERIEAFIILNNDVKQFLALAEVQEISQEAVFFERRFLKKLAEKNAMLATSDWRILPDVVDSYPGEKDMWIKWRNILRNEVIKKPSEFEDSLEYLKYLYNLKFPIDPKLYRQMYPDGKDIDGNVVEYLSTPEQWVKYDVEASSDFITVNAIRALNYTRGFIESRVKVKKRILSILKKFDVEAVYPDYNMDRYEEEEGDE
jgi:hypothetical protein